MSEQTFLVPANSKRAQLIFGFFKPLDLAVFAGGIGLTLILLFIKSVDTITNVIIIIIPVCITGMLVFPLPNYHNVMTLIWDIICFYFFNKRKYIWRGWCYKYEQRDE
ncbi:MAG: hypothetical protein PUC23_05165 [bacterium]|nr:hypothetical protein [bacterium]